MAQKVRKLKLAETQLGRGGSKQHSCELMLAFDCVDGASPCQCQIHHKQSRMKFDRSLFLRAACTKYTSTFSATAHLLSAGSIRRRCWKSITGSLQSAQSHAGLVKTVLWPNHSLNYRNTTAAVSPVMGCKRPWESLALALLATDRTCPWLPDRHGAQCFSARHKGSLPTWAR